MKHVDRFQIVLRAVHHFLVIFLLIAFVITCCMLLFVSTLSRTIGIALTNEHIETAAKLTFVNVVFLSLLFTIGDIIRQKITVDRPIKEITKAAQKIAQGDFSIRIPSMGPARQQRKISRNHRLSESDGRRIGRRGNFANRFYCECIP